MTLRSAAMLTAAVVGDALAAGAGAGARPVETIDLMPLYWQFLDRARTLSTDEQVRLFREMVVERRPEVYNAAVMSVPGGKTFVEALPEIYAKATAWTSPHLETIRTLSSEIATTLPHQQEAFRREFPDFAFDGRVYFLYALGAFDGAARTVEGRPALLFGLDVIAAVNGSGASLAPLFHHELFHAYHGPLIGTTGRGLPLYLSLWTEGLATLVARRLNPTASDLAIHGLPANTPARTRAELPRVASLLREKLDSTSAADYDAFFIGNEPDAAIPRRSGYYVGYLVAARLQQGRPLRDLARLSGPALREAIRAALANPAALAESKAEPDPGRR